MANTDNRRPWPVRLLKKWIWVIGLLPLIYDLIVTYIPSTYLPQAMQDLFLEGIRWEFSVVLLSLGFLVSAYLVHRDTQAELASLYSEKADLKLYQQSFAFLHKEPILIFSNRYEFGINEDGLPIRGIVVASLDIHNVGREEGQLDWELDLELSDMPSIFQVFKGEEDGEMLDLPDPVPARKRTNIVWRLECGIAAEDPMEFARELSSELSFNLVLRYRTLRVVKPSEYSTLRVTGTVTDYQAAIRKRWIGLGKSDLAAVPPVDGSA